MKLFPKFLVKLTDRALAKVPEQHRPIARYAVIVAAVAFLAFEMSRLWIVGRDLALPMFAESASLVSGMARDGNWLGVLITFLLFVGPFALFAWGLRRLTRRVPRST